MRLFRYRSRFLRGVALFLRVLLSYKFLSARNFLASEETRRTRLKALHAENARILRERMIEMRGVMIKIGQFMSSRVDLLPEEYTDELSKLQDQVPPAPFSDIAARVEQELGPLDEVFSSFDETPLASASLGQVHRACLKGGECIVVKVQYPGIEEVIAADIRTLRFVIRILQRLYPHINLEVIYSEFSRIVFEELDYIQEAKNAEAFARNFAANQQIKIPIVYWPFTTKKVLSLEYLEGIKISDFDRIVEQDIDRKQVARVLAEAYAQMFFQDGLFHGDPHPGNIFVCPGPEVILVDFGMVDRISAPGRESLRSAFIAVVDRDALGFVRALVDLGFIPLTRDILPLVQFVDRLIQKYRDISPSEFKAMDIEEIGNDIMQALRLNPSLQIPNEFILFGRVVGMLNGLASTLDPDTNIIEIAAPYARRFIRMEKYSVTGILKEVGASSRAAFKLPHALADFLVTTNRGETRVEITSRQVVDELKNIARIGKGFILAILSAALALVSVFLRINRFVHESYWTAGAAVLLFLWVLRIISKMPDNPR